MHFRFESANYKVMVIVIFSFFINPVSAFSEDNLFKIDMNRVEVYEALNIDTVNSLSIGEFGYAGKYGIPFCNDGGFLKISTATKIDKTINVNKSAYKIFRNSGDQVRIEVVGEEAAHNTPGADLILPIIATARNCKARIDDGSNLLFVASFFGENTLNNLNKTLDRKNDIVVHNQAIKIQELLKKYQSANNAPPKRPEHVEKGKELARKAIDAYQVGDIESWNKIICNSSNNSRLRSWKNVNGSVGSISKVRLLKEDEKTNAGNSSGKKPDYSDASYEFLSSTYPLGLMLFNFSYHNDTKCLYLTY
jgi:hypothetical protein